MTQICKSCLSPLAEGSIETCEGKQVCLNCGAPLPEVKKLESEVGDSLGKAAPGGQEDVKDSF